MSLIFEALKKLERERDTTERGFQVIAQAPWPARSRVLRATLLSIAAGALAGAGAWGAWTWLSSRRAEQLPAPAASAPTAPPSARAALPPPIWESPAPAPAASPVPAPAVTAASAAPAAGASAPATPPPATASAPPASPAGSELRLEAISAQDGEPVAVINGQLVRKGDSVEGALVLSIGTNSVELEVGGRRLVLTF